MSKSTTFYVDAMPIAASRVSGVGHYTLEMIRSFVTQAANSDNRVVLVCTKGNLEQLKAWNIPNVTYKVVPLPYRVWNRLPGMWFTPPIDLFLGKGVYLFPNYRRWPLLYSRSVTWVYDLSFILYPEFATKRSTSFLASNIRNWTKRSDVVMTISQNSKQEIIEHLGIPDDKIRLAYPGVDLSNYYKRPAPEIEEVRNRYNLPKKYILYLGNIEPRKNLARLIRAYGGLPRALKDVHPLVLVGGAGWMQEEIDTEISAARNRGDQIIRPEAYIRDEDLPALFSGATMLAHPAVYEGFGISLVQAMACGTPVLCANTSSMPEVVGHAAVQVDPLSETQILEGLKTILEDDNLRKRLMSEGVQQARRFTWDECAKSIAAATAYL